MKKMLIASAIAMTMSAGSAMANNQQSEIQFLGVVTETTCDISSSVDGAVNEVVQLGTVKKGEMGEVKSIFLKAKAGTTCANLANKTATILFQGPLGDKGLENSKGSAANTYVELKAANAKTANQDIKKGSNSADFDAELVNNTGYQIDAKLKADDANATAGTFESALAYAVTYK